MGIRDLNELQLRQVKEAYFIENHDVVSMGELADINELVKDEEVFEFYASTEFVNDDFWG